MQAEVTIIKTTSNQSGAEFVNSIEAQAKILDRVFTEDDELTRLKESLTHRKEC